MARLWAHTPPRGGGAFPVLFTTLLAFALVLACNFAPCAEAQEQHLRSNATHDRKGKLLSIFQLVTFPNDPCSGGTKNGTCYTQAECSQRGGTNAGSCAGGFGVCCTITLNCGGSSSENCTYFDSNAITAGGCSVQVCPCGNNICQMRLDFVNFVIAGPSSNTASVTTLLAKSGVANPTGAVAVSDSTQCLTDTFSVSMGGGGINPPTICGTNTGEHMYVDVCDNNCNNLNFAFGNTGVNTAIPNRAFSIKVTQYSCNYPNLAPSGCTQYFFGMTTGTLNTFNYNGGNGQHLANQDQSFCVRRERGNCRICYYAVNPTDFHVSATSTGSTKKGFNKGSVCCSYGASTTKGYDCLMIPGAVNTAGVMKGNNICGGNIGLITTISGAATTLSKSICSNKQPFLVNFRSDNYETNTIEDAIVDRGFTLGYTMDSINCP